MPRTELNLPDRFAFAIELPVRITDVNYGQHLGNDAVFALLHEARMQFLAQHGCSETDIGGGVGLIMTDAACVFRAQARYGDRLRVEVAVSRAGGTSFDLQYRMSRLPTGETVVEAKTGMACFDYRRGRPARMPAEFRRLYCGDAPAGTASESP